MTNNILTAIIRIIITHNEILEQLKLSSDPEKQDIESTQLASFEEYLKNLNQILSQKEETVADA